MNAETHSDANRPTALLVPGYWLGGWVWDDVVSWLTALGRPAEAITLPGLESVDVDRSRLRFEDHVGHVLDRVRAADAPVVLVAHSGAGAVATAVADNAPDSLRRVVYVDSGPVADGTVPTPDVSADAVELPFPGFDALAADGASTEGLSDEDKARVQDRAVAQPAGVCRGPVLLRDPRRNTVPVTLVCCSLPSATVRSLAASGAPMFAAVSELTELTTVDLPTGHWPMLSRPDDLATIIAEQAARA